jgi:hypothetical protein
MPRVVQQAIPAAPSRVAARPRAIAGSLQFARRRAVADDEIVELCVTAPLARIPRSGSLIERALL